MNDVKVFLSCQLQYVNESKTFFILSLAVRIVSAVGESAFFCAIYPLATEVKHVDILTYIKIERLPLKQYPQLN